MSKKIKIYDTSEVKWPSSCAKCRATENLHMAEASSGRVTSISPTMSGSIAITGELLNLSYPVCSTHSKGLAFANFITRKTLGLSILRGMIYLIGGISLLFIPLFLLKFIEGLTGTGTAPDMPVAILAIYAVFGFLFIKLISAYAKLPLRIVSQSSDIITIKFKNNVYATQFMRLNKDILSE